MSRQSTIKKGAEHRRSLGQPDDGPELKAPSYQDYVDEFYHGTIGIRNVLSMGDRLIPALTAVCYRGAERATRRLTGTALENNLAPRAIIEIFVQSILYSGLPRAEEAIEIANGVFVERGIELPDDPPDNRTVNDLDVEAARVMETLHGARQSNGYDSPDNPVTFTLYQGAVRHGYGNLWVRRGLDLRQRMICAIAGFTVLGLHNSLLKFSISARNVGLTNEEIAEAAIQTAPWNSLPVALTALTIISEAQAEVG